jgi:hypothetical protein
MRTYLLLLACAVASGCGDETDPPPDDDTGSVVVGVTSELREQVDIQRLHVRMTAGGTSVRDDDLTDALKFPAEFAFETLPDATPVEIQLDAFGTSGPALLTRLASSKVVAGKRLLLPVRLQSACIAGLPGSSGPVCEAPQTCISGSCQPSFVEPATLPEYTAEWSQAPDACKPTGGGDPIVIVGQGQADYLPMEDGEVGQVEAGPQGGYHIWIAIRLKNLRQSGSITEVTGTFPGLGFDADPYKVIFTFDQDEGGYCKLPGLRFRLDTPEHPIEELLGKPVEVRVKVTDKDGAVGEGVRTVLLSTTYL